MCTIHIGHDVCVENPIKVSVLFSHPSSRTRSRGRARVVDFRPVGGGPTVGRWRSGTLGLACTRGGSRPDRWHAIASWPRPPMARHWGDSGAAGRLRGAGCYIAVQCTREEDGVAGAMQTVMIELGRQHSATMADMSRAGERRRSANPGRLGQSPAVARDGRTPRA
jgi:hypothetical protein